MVVEDVILGHQAQLTIACTCWVWEDYKDGCLTLLFHCRYPVAEIDCFEKGKPNAVEVLGYKFVAWQDKQGDWHAARDVCPHRCAWIIAVTVALGLGQPRHL